MERRNVSVMAEGIDIRGELYLPGEGKVFPALCICHGIPSGNPPDPADGGYPLLAERFCKDGFITTIFNFRGTGISGGNFDLLGWVKDLEAVISYLHSLPEVDRSQLCLMGFSGGAAVSAYVAAHDPRISKVILCACPAEFSSLTNQGESQIEHFRRIGMFRDKDFPRSSEEWLNGFRHVAPINWIDKIAPRSLLLMHGNKGVDHAWRLYEKAREPKEIAIIEDGEHKLRLSEKAIDTALKWLKRGQSN